MTNTQDIRTMIITPTSIEFRSEYVRPSSIINGHIELVPGCLLPNCDIYCDEEGMYKRELCMNTLANPIIDEFSLIHMAMTGGPVGTLVVVRESKRPLPIETITRMYRNYEDDEENEWYEALMKAINQM